MNKWLLFAVPSILALSSCSNDKDVYDQNAADQIANANAVPDVDIAEMSNFKMTKTYNVPVQAGMVTVVTKGKDTLAVTDHAITMNIPKAASVVNKSAAKQRTRGTETSDPDMTADAESIMVQYEDVNTLKGYVPGTSMAKEETVLMFEDSPVNCDYDYNDVVLLVKYTTTEKNSKKYVSVAVKPLAFGAKYNIKFGFDYASVSTTEGNETKTTSSTGVVLSNNVKQDYFGGRTLNTTGTYSSVIPLKAYTINKPFVETISNLGDDGHTLACVKYDRKSFEQIDNKDTVTVSKDNEGFYQYAPIEVSSFDGVKFFIAPEIPLTYTKTSTYTINGTTLTGKIKYTSVFTYKLYAGDCNLKAASLIPYGIAIPVTALTKGYVFWPYETQPIWAGFPDFKNWLSASNDNSWINTYNESSSFDAGGQTWNASLLIKGAATTELVLPDVDGYATNVENAVEAAQKAENTKKVDETVTNAEQAQ